MCSLTLCSLSPAASQLLQIYARTFLNVVNPKLSLLKLEHKGVISPDVATALENSKEEDAKYLLFQHLKKNATVDTMREYCKVAIAADGYPRMQELGRKMMETLPLGGWSHLWWWVGTLSAPHVCVPLSHCVHTYMYVLYWTVYKVNGSCGTVTFSLVAVINLFLLPLPFPSPVQPLPPSLHQ